jgi:hypothetical protein
VRREVDIFSDGMVHSNVYEGRGMFDIGRASKRDSRYWRARGRRGISTTGYRLSAAQHHGRPAKRAGLRRIATRSKEIKVLVNGWS